MLSKSQVFVASSSLKQGQGKVVVYGRVGPLLLDVSRVQFPFQALFFFSAFGQMAKDEQFGWLNMMKMMVT